MNRRDFITGLAAGAGYALTAGGILEPVRRFWQVSRSAPVPMRGVFGDGYIHIAEVADAELDPAMRFNTGEAEIAKNITAILLDPSRVDAHGDVASREAIVDAAAIIDLPTAPEGLEFVESYIDAKGRWLMKMRVVDGEVLERLRAVGPAGGGISMGGFGKIWALEGV